MRSTLYLSCVSTFFLLGTAFAQAPAPASPKDAAKPAMAETVSPTPMVAGLMWRGSKLMGINIYDSEGPKLGDIEEILMDSSSKVSGYVIGVGGFLGLGEHNILVTPDKLKFVNEPMRMTSTTITPDKTTAPAPNAVTTSVRPARAANEKWYPDHAVMAATKDQLKALPEFKYGNYK
jgi:sporulation protein YlmC with PRC-barrel domain